MEDSSSQMTPDCVKLKNQNKKRRENNQQASTTHCQPGAQIHPNSTTKFPFSFVSNAPC